MLASNGNMWTLCLQRMDLPIIIYVQVAGSAHAPTSPLLQSRTCLLCRPACEHSVCQRAWIFQSSCVCNCGQLRPRQPHAASLKLSSYIRKVGGTCVAPQPLSCLKLRTLASSGSTWTLCAPQRMDLHMFTNGRGSACANLLASGGGYAPPNAPLL